MSTSLRARACAFPSPLQGRVLSVRVQAYGMKAEYVWADGCEGRPEKVRMRRLRACTEAPHEVAALRDRQGASLSPTNTVAQHSAAHRNSLSDQLSLVRCCQWNHAPATARVVARCRLPAD